MKKITFVLSFLIIPLSFLFSQNISTNGWKFPNTGTARVFIVFAEAVGDPEYSTVNSNWPAGSMPINPDAYADVIYNSSNVNGYLTKYFDEMSFGANSGLDNYVVIGDYFPDLVQINYGDFSGSGFYEVIDYLNAIPSFDIITQNGFSINNDFDNWTYSPVQGSPKVNSPDNYIDMVLVVWRVNQHLSTSNNSGSIGLNTYNYPLKSKAGFTAIGSFRTFSAAPGIMHHEFAHSIFGTNAMHAGGAGVLRS